MLLRCPACQGEVFKRHLTVPLICPNCGATARPSAWNITLKFILILLLGAGAHFSFVWRTIWPVLASLTIYYAGGYPLRYMPLMPMRRSEIIIHEIIHNFIVIFFVGIIVMLAYVLFLDG